MHKENISVMKLQDRFGSNREVLHRRTDWNKINVCAKENGTNIFNVNNLMQKLLLDSISENIEIYF